MKLQSKSEWFVLESPIAEPNEKWDKNEKYHIQRIVREDGAIVWFGLSVNWKKELNGVWTELATNDDAKPLEKYLPEIVYGEDRTYLKVCEMPIYEKLYLEKQENLKKEFCEELISYIENDAEIAMPINELMREDGTHLTKKEYGHVLLKHLAKELRERFSKINEGEKLK